MIPALKDIRQKKIFEVFERFPNLPSRTLARVLFNEAPELFGSVEHARARIRYYRGRLGNEHRRDLAMRKYVQPL